ncbi:MAG: ATP-binding protein [Myxococcota bacterium]|nr:ATP-binding protein [Myxococcota bacterium]
MSVLHEDGDAPTRARVLRALGDEASVLERPDGWLAEEALQAMLEAARFDRSRAQRMGQALVKPSTLSLALCYSGLASPPKAYRRVDALLAREAQGGRYTALHVGEGNASIQYEYANRSSTDGGPEVDWRECGEVLCGMRQGMLSAVPGLFGLTPARVIETACVGAGDPFCEFSVQWRLHRRRALWLGASAGFVLGAVSFLTGFSSGLLWPALTLLGAALGRSLDLALQLEAVAGVSRGQIALLEQLDAGLSDRMDALAQLQGDEQASRALPVAASLDRGEGLIPASPPGDFTRTPPGETTCLVRQGAARIYESSSVMRDDLTSLQARFAGTDQGEVLGRLQSCEQQGRRIAEAASEIDRAVGGGVMRRKTDLRALVDRAISGLRSDWPSELEIQLDAAGALPPVNCDPLQIEVMIEQLLKNASEANGGVGTVTISLSPHSEGVEVAVTDQGAGIEDELLDEVFDPFVSEPDEEAPTGLGLPVCFRIVEEHGGELRFQPGADGGARVAFVLPVE